MHTATVIHLPLGYSGIAPVERLVNSDATPMPGSMFSVNAYAYELYDPFGIDYGVKVRMIADPSNWDNTVGVLVPGQSGHLFNPHRFDQIALWQKVEYRAMPFSRKAVEENAEATLTLTP